MSTTRRHSRSVRPSIAQRHMPKHEDADVAAVIDVIRNTPACSRERDMRLLELSYEQLKLYLDACSIVMEPEMYRQQVRDYWQYVDANPHIYNHDGTTHWGRPERMH